MYLEECAMYLSVDIPRARSLAFEILSRIHRWVDGELRAHPCNNRFKLGSGLNHAPPFRGTQQISIDLLPQSHSLLLLNLFLPFSSSFPFQF